MDGIVPLLIGLIILTSLVVFIVSIALIWISYRRTFKTDKAFMISMLNVLLTVGACGLAYFLADSVAGNGGLLFTGFMFIISVIITIRISKRSETKWVE